MLTWCKYVTSSVIRVTGLGKKYRIGATLQQYRTVRESLSGAIRAPIRAGFRVMHGQGVHVARPEFWALRDISFEVKRGEVLGIIGRNGAGKSTLLKLLSRITEPTSGEIRVRGRMASLLEVGTGFHPELTGRENVFLNGAILGMSRAETALKFDQIVAFAEVEDFIDTQVKHYSSGMYMRLAFAVAAHLEPDILIIDEVLAVGDAAFQQKSLGKISEVSAGGRTVLFVSHNASAVQRLCSSAILLEHGLMVQCGPTREVIRSYEHIYSTEPTGPATRRDSISANGLNADLETEESRQHEGEAYACPAHLRDDDCYIELVEMLDDRGQRLAELFTWDKVRFRFWYRSTIHEHPASVEFWIKTLGGTTVLYCSTQPDSNVSMDLYPGRHYVDCLMLQFPLASGKYLFGVGLAKPGDRWLFRDEASGTLEVSGRDVFASGLIPTSDKALVVVPHRWTIPD